MSDAQAQFEEMLIALTSGNTELIRQAEEAYNDAVKSDPVWVIQALTEVGVNSANASASNIALVQLRKLLSRNLTAFDACPIEVQTHVKTSLINFFGSTTEKLLRRAAAGCISNLAVKLSSDGNNAWPELWELLMNALGDENADPEIRAACCLIFGQTAAWLAAAYLRAHMQNIMTTLQSCVAFGHSQLAVEAAHALRALIDNADKKDIPAITHSPIIPSLIESAGNYILNGDAETAESIIEDLCDIAEDNVEVLKPHANTIFNAMSSIAQNAELEKDLRHHAIDLVLTYGESDPKTFRKAKQFTTAFFELMVQYVTRPEMEDNWSNTYEDSTTTNGSDFEAGASAMDRMCVVLRGKQVQDMATNHIMANINSDQWEMRAAALTVLTYVAEGCHKQFMRYLDMIVDELILPRMTDEHPMVRYCACQAIAQLSTDFKPMWQEGYAAKLLPPLCEILNDPVPRLRAMAAATIDQFFDDLDEDDEDEYDEEEWANRVSDYKSMQPFMNHILQALFAALTNAEYDFQRKTLLTCFATVLQVAGKIAAPFVQDLVPLFQGLLAAPDSSESEDAFRLSRQIKCGAIECTTLLASNVGNEHFGVYGHQVCQYLMSLLQEGLSNDDMRLRYILRGWTCMVECLGAEVLPYLEVVMPQLLNVANLECDAVVTEAEAGDEDDHANDNSESKVQIVRVMDKDGAKNVKLHTSLIEDKDLAITIIMVILQEIKGGAAPWVSQITDTCIKLLEFLAFPDIRDTAAETLAALSVCVKEADPDKATNFVQYIITPLLSAMESEPELHVARQMVETLGIVVDNAPHGSLYDEPVHNAAKILEEIFSESLRRLEKFLVEHDKKKAHESEEEEEAQTLEALAKGEDFMLTEVAETVGKLVKTTPAFIEHYEREFLPLVTRLIDPTKPSTYHRLGICLLCDYVEYAPQSASVHLSTIAEAMVQFMQSSDPEVIQASMFGAGITAELVAQVVPQPNDQSSEFAQAVCDTAMRYLLTPDSREAENFSVSANAVSCILRVIQAFSHAVNMHAAMQAVVQHLPVQDDKTEEIRINDMLVQWAMDPANPALQDATLRRQVIFAVKRSKYMSDAARDALASL